MFLSDTGKPGLPQPLLVLDIDETLLFAATSPLPRACDYKAQRTWIYKRPHVDPFLRFCATHFETAVWTGARRSYTDEILRYVFSDFRPAFVLCEQHCINMSPIDRRHIAIKPLSNLSRLGYSLDRILAVDDTPENHCLNPENLIHIPPYRAAGECHALPLLQRYLEHIKDQAQLNTIDHRCWPQVAGAL